MDKFLGKDPADSSVAWKEWQIQGYIVMHLRRMGYIAHGDTNGASKTPRGWSEASAAGMQAGWPDITILGQRGAIWWVEVKVRKGRVSVEQEELHDRMADFGHTVHVVWADSPADGLDKVMKIIGQGGGGC